jgi:hypothetical protein
VSTSIEASSRLKTPCSELFAQVIKIKDIKINLAILKEPPRLG